MREREHERNGERARSARGKDKEQEWENGQERVGERARVGLEGEKVQEKGRGGVRESKSKRERERVG